MKLYQTYTSPFPTRVRLVLYAKGLAPEIIEPPGFHATTESKGDYFDINPIGRVPALVTDDGRALPESEVICEYLEDAYPDPPTLPPDPWGRAQVRLISRLCDFYLVMAMRPLFTASGMSRRRWDRAAIDRALAERAPPPALGVDGGLAGSDVFLQLQADLLGHPLRRHAVREATACGAAICAARGVGLLGADDAGGFVAYERTFEPAISRDQADARFAAWKQAAYG